MMIESKNRTRDELMDMIQCNLALLNHLVSQNKKAFKQRYPDLINQINSVDEESKLQAAL